MKLYPVVIKKRETRSPDLTKKAPADRLHLQRTQILTSSSFNSFSGVTISPLTACHLSPHRISLNPKHL
ncbi:hypothetical protein L1987_10697 [Smallanthus sonchifolius]|uniref:Uncharacterized protein n=1 Tax=Smallanthus sonchifolius TaxID=185202 RepID=A0ACB9JCB7_9ASTR|nr:hypothetical protein L1987_10697 [Smallanthus sonchifolius]